MPPPQCAHLGSPSPNRRTTVCSSTLALWSAPASLATAAAALAGAGAVGFYGGEGTTSPQRVRQRRGFAHTGACKRLGG
eukprot:CAMPEP_0171127816 /NCGR_PEP_ID=MMETSP0766_2-20121228/115927_1 /TAXON_ID=439317 /ORGANISM="Gambierdiscus australes, Strain CAWD 149" /LENGTH=78 /DNA_ID=CAMNT_0011590933 /DNA_START=37 /DNA_END=270 /DNA_ORIENTATION=+